ncbi:MAG: hypothetical protein IKC11_04540 [Clostridia bacterium]|nr:hypothetical protein [Clostridia bacterium]
MAQKSTNTTTTATTTKKTTSLWGVLNIVSFAAVICVGVSLLLSRVGLGGRVSGALSTIAQVISYVVLIAFSCFYIAKRRNLTLWIIWIISVVLIVISFIL